MVEDSENDISLLRRTLKKGGYNVTCEIVETLAAMRVALKTKKNWDIITSDHSMPYFCAPDALALAKELCPEVPFIILSGEIDRTMVVELIKNGAKAYIQKNEMELILPVIERELKEGEILKSKL